MGKPFSVAISVTRFCLGTFRRCQHRTLHLQPRFHDSLVKVLHAPPFCVGMCERIRHGWPLQQQCPVSVLENTRQGLNVWVSLPPPTKHFPHLRSSYHRAVRLSVHIQRKDKAREMASLDRGAVRCGLALAAQSWSAGVPCRYSFFTTVLPNNWPLD
jgi:hypothetical protein